MDGCVDGDLQKEEEEEECVWSYGDVTGTRGPGFEQPRVYIVRRWKTL